MRGEKEYGLGRPGSDVRKATFKEEKQVAEQK